MGSCEPIQNSKRQTFQPVTTRAAALELNQVPVLVFRVALNKLFSLAKSHETLIFIKSSMISNRWGFVKVKSDTV